MNKKIILLISIASILVMGCEQSEGDNIKIYHHPNKLFSISWNSKEWKQNSIAEEIVRQPDGANNLPRFDLILLDKKNKDLRFSIATQLPILYGDLHSKKIRDGFRYSILTYPGAEELYSNTFTINNIWAYRIDYKVSEKRLGYENVKIFSNVLIINKNYWHIFHASSPITDNLQNNIALWNRIYPIVKTFKSQ